MNAYWKGIVLGLVVLSAPVMAQEKPAVWDLKSCINYARAHNIQIRQSRIAWEESLENTKQAKAGPAAFSFFYNGSQLCEPSPSRSR